MGNIPYTKLAPTAEAIDAWMAKEKKFWPDGTQKYATEYAEYGVNVWTKSSRARCITTRVVSNEGVVGYWTIVGEGSSNGCRRYIVWEPQIIKAEGWIVGQDEVRLADACPMHPEDGAHELMRGERRCVYCGAAVIEDETETA